MIEIMGQVRCHLILFLLATGLFWADETKGQNRLVFPTPDRPVAPIVSSDRLPESLMFLISAPRRAARLIISARGMTLSIAIVSVMVLLPKPAIPLPDNAPPVADR